MDTLIDGVLGDSNTTVLERTTATAVAAPPRPRGPIEWPPRTSGQPGAMTFTRPPSAFARLGARLRRSGQWTYTGLHSRTRVVIVLLVTGALVVAAVMTTRALASTASTNFAGVLTAASPVQLNFPASGTITSIDVSPGETVQVGQLIATQQNTALAQQVQSDYVALASDEQRLAELLGSGGGVWGPAARVTLQQATAAYNKAQAEATAEVAKGATGVVQEQDVLLAAEQVESNDNAQLVADTQEYNSRCTKGLGQPGCAALSRLKQNDQNAFDLAQARVAKSQAAYTAAQGIDGTLQSVATQETKIASEANPLVTANLAVQVSAARDAIAHDEAQVASDRLTLEGASIYAPVAGTVISVNGAPGELSGGGGVRSSSSGSTGGVPGSQTSGTTPSPSGINSSSSSSTLVTIDASPGLEAIAQVPETYIDQIYRGESATITVDVQGGRSYAGRVQIVEPAPVVAAGTVFYDVVITPAGSAWPASSLLPGMTANITIP